MRAVDAILQSYLVWSRRIVIAISILMLVAMVGAHSLDITARAVQRASVSWVQEFSILAAMWVYFFAYALIAKDDQYIRVDFLVARLRPRLRSGIDLLARAATIAFHAIVVWFGLETYRFLGLFKTSVLEWPESLFVVPLLLGSADILLTEMIRLYRQLTGREPRSC